MNYILKPDLLPLSSKLHTNKETLYVQWMAKQQLQKELQQRLKLQKILNNIVQQEKDTCPHNSNPRKDFYAYSVQWKNNIDQKIQKQKEDLYKIKQQEQEAVITVKRPDKKFAYQNANKQHTGPIKGWNEHFNNYMLKKQKNYLESQFQFNPEINKKSNMIVGVSPYPVEERLIRYGQLCRIKKQQALINQNKSNYNSKNQKTFDGGNSDLFYRLYREADRLNRIKKQNELITPYSFKPQINELSETMNEKVEAIRKPLYHIKDTSNIDNNIKINNNEKVKKVNFGEFIKRNQALLQKRSKRQVNKIQNDRQKQKQDQKQCTFSPKINKQSLKIFKDRIQSEDKGLEDRMVYLLNRHRNLDLIKQDTEQHDNIAVKPVKNQQQHDYLGPNISEGTIVQFTSRTIKNHSQIKKNDINQSQSWLQQSSAKVVTQKIEEDSIQKMRTSQWETQLQQVQNQIEQMMKRTFYR